MHAIIFKINDSFYVASLLLSTCYSFIHVIHNLKFLSSQSLLFTTSVNLIKAQKSPIITFDLL